GRSRRTVLPCSRAGCHDLVDRGCRLHDAARESRHHPPGRPSRRSTVGQAMTAEARSADFARPRYRRRGSELWIDAALLAPGCGFLLLAMAVPIAQLLLASIGLFGLGSADALTLGNYVMIFNDVLMRSGFFFSLRIGFATTICSVVIATLLTALLQIEFPGRHLVSVLYKIPLVVPSLEAAFLVLTMIGPGGMAA